MTNQNTESIFEIIGIFFESHLYVIYILSLFGGLLVNRMFSRKMSKPKNTKSTVEGLRSLLRDIKPAGGQKTATVPVGANVNPFMSKDFAFMCPSNSYNEVYPGIYVGDHRLAEDTHQLAIMGFTHVLNAAQGQKFAQVDTSNDTYAHLDIKFLGINAQDTARCKLSDHFKEAADFILDAISTGGKVYVHCFQGVSRSATLVIVYLMIHRNLSVEDALKKVRQKRAIFPNDGFLKQLCELNEELATSRKNSAKTSATVVSENDMVDNDSAKEGQDKSDQSSDDSYVHVKSSS